MHRWFVVVYIVWLFSEIALTRLKRSGQSDLQHADKHTLSLIWIVIIISIIAGTTIANKSFHPIMQSLVISYVGLALVVFGMILRLIVVRSLGRYFTVDVVIRQDHQIKKTGFYKYIRHPSYLASLISFVGFGLSLNNWIALLIVTIPVFMAFVIRTNQEEKALTSHFGQEYVVYKKTTKKIIPFIY